jgi:hypothetical protein
VQVRGLSERNADEGFFLSFTATGAQGLKAILAYAISNGAQYIEITPDIAGDDAECGPAIKFELNQIVGQTQTNCLYAD